MLIYFIILLLLLVAEVGYFRIADRFNIVDRPNERSSHTRVVLRGGGIIFAVGVLVWFVAFGWPHPLFVAGLLLLAVVSLWDDIRSLPDSVRLVAQFAAMLLMFADWGIIRWDLWWLVLAAWVLCVGIINAYNFMDGINGMTGGYSAVVLLSLLWLNGRLSFAEPSLILVILLADLVFCLFNFRSRARCFAGDVGSVGMAFVVVYLVGRLILQTGDFTYILLLAVYGVDTVLTICHRILLHEPLGQAHRKHAYQLLSNELHWPHVGVSLLYMALQAVVSLGLILLPNQAGPHWIYAGVVLAVLAAGYLLFMRRYYPLHEAYLANLNKQ